MTIFNSIGYTLTELFRKPDNDNKLINKPVPPFIHQRMFLKRVEKKKLLVFITRLRTGCLVTFKKSCFFKKMSHLRCSIKKLFLLFSSEYCKILRRSILKSIWEWLLLKMCSWNWEKLKIIHKELKKQVYSTSISETSDFSYVNTNLVSHKVCVHIQYFFGMVRNKL